MKNVTSSVLEDVATFMGNCGNEVLEKKEQKGNQSQKMKVGEAESYVCSPDFYI